MAVPIGMKDGTFVDWHEGRDANGNKQVKLELRGSDGKTFEVPLDGSRSSIDLANSFVLGESIRAQSNYAGGTASLINESRGTHTFAGEDGKLHTERNLHHSVAHGGSTEHGKGHGGEHLNTIDCGDTSVMLPSGKDAEAVVKSVKKGDRLATYTDAQGFPVVYNETRNTVSRRDEHGHYHTSKQRALEANGDLEKISRDPHNKDQVTLEVRNEVGQLFSVTVTDDPKNRLDEKMRPGDRIHAKFDPSSPGAGAVDLRDSSRNVHYAQDRHGRHEITEGERARPTSINGVTHQHADGPKLPTAPNAIYNGNVVTLKDNHGVVDVTYKDVMGKMHTLSVDGNAAPSDGNPGHSSVGAAAMKILRPGDDFMVQFRPDGTYSLRNEQTHDVANPGRDGQPQIENKPGNAVEQPAHHR